MNGTQLNKILKIGAKHALYREDGIWYHHLKKFPGALFDKNGYLLFETKSDYNNNLRLQRKKDLHIQDGISSINGYKRFTSNEREFISQHELFKFNRKDHYNTTPVSNKIARLTYNNNGWIYPSGWEGKSKSKKSHEGQYGFGGEEWLFDFNKIINGHNYGFIQPVEKAFEKHKGLNYNILFFTINNTDKSKYWIGKINNCQILTREERTEITVKFNKKSWREERIKQLKDLGLWNKIVANNLRSFTPNVKFKNENVELFDPPIIVGEAQFMKNRWRYQIFEWPEGVEMNSSQDSHFNFIPSGPNDIISIKRSKSAEPLSKEVKQLHREISKEMYNFLVLKYGEKNLACDCPTGKGTFIDMVRKDGRSFIFYEIKTYNDLRKSIREAFGQLIEYAYWNCKKLAKEIVIVTDRTPGQEIENYFAFIRMNFAIPIFYQQFDLKSNTLFKKY